MRSTLIFGNGIGMALDPHHFSLSRALYKIWNGNVIPQEHKQLISSCLHKAFENCPQGENDLDIMHIAMSCCDLLKSISGQEQRHWLSQYGWDFPLVCREFIYHVACELYDHDAYIPNNFGNGLSEFILKSNSHVATLNYDRLLYDLFLKNNILSGYSGSLIDGIVNAGFHQFNFERRYGRNFGFYLHLHGSPLFRERDGVIKKLAREELFFVRPEPSSHIVLTHTKHKKNVIAYSTILSSYWQQLYLAISESAKVFLFGYSGCDYHLNELLSLNFQNKEIIVIEWNGSGNNLYRQQFWDSALRRAVKLIQMDCILDFNQWD